jgi:hypothetical protein
LATRLFSVLIAVLLFAVVGLSQVSAQAGPVLVDEGVTNSFPDGMEFRVSVGSASPIEELRLRYEILPDGTRANAEPDFDPSESFTASFTLEGNAPPRIYLPPGTTVVYYWEATDANGTEVRTEEATFVYDDVRFDWKSVESGGVTIHYYSGSEDDARAMLDVASESIADMSSLLGAEIDFPVKVLIYESRDDMRPALISRSESYESQIITAGVRVSSDTVLVLGNVSFDTLRHELTHVVTKVAGESAFGEVPAWLDEGTAVYGQSNPGGFGDAIADAINRGNVLSVRSITSYPGDPSKVALFYGEGWSLVSFLIDTYGSDKFAELYATIKGGERIDGALEAIYGFDQDGLEDEWRAANGLPPRDTPEAAGDDAPATDVPDDTDGRQAAEDEGSPSAGAIAGIVASVLVLGLVVVGGGFLIVRRTQR